MVENYKSAVRRFFYTITLTKAYFITGHLIGFLQISAVLTTSKVKMLKEYCLCAKYRNLRTKTTVRGEYTKKSSEIKSCWRNESC